MSAPAVAKATMKAILDLGLVLRLYTDVDPDGDPHDPDTYDEASFAGYAPVRLSPSSWSIIAAEGVAVHPPVRFVLRDQPVAGWMMTADTEVLFTGPVPGPAREGDAGILELEPRLEQDV